MLDTLLQRWPGVVFHQRPDFTFAFVSPRLEAWTGVPAAQWRDEAALFWRVVHEADAEALRARWPSFGEATGELTSTYRLRHVLTGRVTHVRESRQPVRDAKGRLLGYAGLWLDVTRQTLAEERLLRLSWKESLATITMGLTHDLRNFLTSLVWLSDTYEAELAQNSALRSGLRLIRNTGTQAGELADRLRQLHRGAPDKKNYQDLNEVVSGLAAILQRVLSRRVRLVTDLAPGGPMPLWVDAFALRQVIVNLAWNAVEAMPKGGRLTLRTTRHAQPPAVPPCQGALPRPPLLGLSVQDTGSGIAPRHLNLIFDPFFTTKPPGQAAGLGLYIARLFAEEHGAAISVDTAPAAGTTFHLWFAQADFTEAATRETARPQTRHTWLVVAPAGATLERRVATLREHGYYAVAATSEAEASDLLQAPEYCFTGLLVLGLDGQPWAGALCRRVRSEKRPLKIALGCHRGDEEEPDAARVAAMDTLVSLDLPATEFVTRLKSVLDQP